jgi:hypothetical protein
MMNDELKTAAFHSSRKAHHSSFLDDKDLKALAHPAWENQLARARAQDDVAEFSS